MQEGGRRALQAGGVEGTEEGAGLGQEVEGWLYPLEEEGPVAVE